MPATTTPTVGGRVAGVVLVVLGSAVALAAPALASTASEQRQGASALQRFERHGKRCSSLTKSDAELIGEYVMGRTAGSVSAHDAMNSMMERMMGRDATDQMHVVLGERYTRCGGRAVPGRFRSMMGVMGMGGISFRGGSPRNKGFGSMMGGSRSGFGSMMGRRGSGSHHGDSNGVEIATFVILGVLGALGVTALCLWRRQRRGTGSALDILNERLAHGELNQHDYERRRRAIETPGAPGG